MSVNICDLKSSGTVFNGGCENEKGPNLPGRAVVLSGALWVTGCSTSSKDGVIINSVAVASQLGNFDVLANVPKQKSGTIANSISDEVDGGTISIDPTDVTVTPTANPSGKSSTAS